MSLKKPWYRRPLPLALLTLVIALVGSVVWLGPNELLRQGALFLIRHSERQLAHLVDQPLPIASWRDAAGELRNPSEEPARPTLVYVAEAGCSACSELEAFLVELAPELDARRIEVRVLMGDQAPVEQTVARDWVRRLDDPELLRRLRGTAYPTLYFLRPDLRVETFSAGYSREALLDWIHQQPVATPAAT